MTLVGNYTQRYFAILEVMRKRTDSHHRLQLQQIADELLAMTGMTADRRSVRKSLEEIKSSGYPLVYDRGWYYKHEFSYAELDFLTDSVRLNSSLTPAAQRELLTKIRSLGSDLYEPIANADDLHPSNEKFFRFMREIHEAIREGVQIEFYYGSYDVDKQLHVRRNRMGNARVYVVNPYDIACVNGKYYLIGNVHNYDGLCHFRIDRIIDMKVKKRPIKPMSEAVVDGETDLPHYLVQHPYMYTGKVRKYTLHIDRKVVNDVLDWFGTDVVFSEVTEEEADVTILSEPRSMDFWMRRYGDNAMIIGIERNAATEAKKAPKPKAAAKPKPAAEPEDPMELKDAAKPDDTGEAGSAPDGPEEKENKKSE